MCYTKWIINDTLFKTDIENKNSFAVEEKTATFWLKDTTSKWYLRVTEDT